MQTDRIVSRLLDDCVPFMHLARWRALCDVCRSAVCGSWLSLSTLACGTPRATALRHRIKCVDRLLGNSNLHRERRSVYRALAQRWLSDLPQLLIVVDWSTLSADMQWHWLRASVVVDGRSLTLYEEVHPRRHLGNRGVHQRFIERLARILPPTTQAPIIMTDAGFRTTWFQLLARRGWYWVGRIRNREFVRSTERDWFPA
ncbi:MAG: transposase, partial [Rhodocyclales bacterium]|nr:transposase [Rhodocyclales bacterium]